MKTHTKHFIATGHIGILEKELDLETELLPNGIMFCEYLGTKYQCCKNKVCFDNSPCEVRRFRDKYENYIKLGKDAPK